MIAPIQKIQGITGLSRDRSCAPGTLSFRSGSPLTNDRAMAQGTGIFVNPAMSGEKGTFRRTPEKDLRPRNRHRSACERGPP